MKRQRLSIFMTILILLLIATNVFSLEPMILKEFEKLQIGDKVYVDMSAYNTPTNKYEPFWGVVVYKFADSARVYGDNFWLITVSYKFFTDKKYVVNVGSSVEIQTLNNEITVLKNKILLLTNLINSFILSFQNLR